MTAKKDLRHTPEYKIFRTNVIQSQPVCQRCGADRKLQLHHLQNCAQNPGLVLERSNVVVLCTDCHHLIHNTIRRRN